MVGFKTAQDVQKEKEMYYETRENQRHNWVFQARPYLIQAKCDLLRTRSGYKDLTVPNCGVLETSFECCEKVLKGLSVLRFNDDDKFKYRFHDIWRLLEDVVDVNDASIVLHRFNKDKAGSLNKLMDIGVSCGFGATFSDLRYHKHRQQIAPCENEDYNLQTRRVISLAVAESVYAIGMSIYDEWLDITVGSYKKCIAKMETTIIEEEVCCF